MNVKQKLIGGLLLAVVLPVAAISVANIHFMKEAIHSSFQEKIEADVKRVLGKEIPEMMKKAAHYIEFLGADASVAKAAYYAISIGSPGEMEALLKEKTGRLGLSFMEVVNPAGKVVAGTLAQRVGQTPRQEGEGLKEEGRGSSLYFGQDGGEGRFLLLVSAPILRNDKPIGQIRGGYLFGPELLGSFAGDGRLALYGPDSRSKVETAPLGLDEALVSEVFESVKKACAASVEHPVCRNPTSRVVNHRSDQSFILSITPFRMGAAAPLGSLVVAKEATALENELGRAVWSGVAMAAFFSLLAAVFGWLVALSLTRAIEAVGRGIQVMASGQLTTRLPVSARPNEIERIAMHVNSLAQSLRRTIRQLTLQSDTLLAIVPEAHAIEKELRSDSRMVRELSVNMVRLNDQVDSESFTIRAGIDAVHVSLEQVNDLAEQLSGNMTTIAAATEQASQNVSLVASAAEEMTANMAQVNGNLTRVENLVGRVAGAVKEMTGSQNDVRKRTSVARKESGQALQVAKGVGEAMEALARSTHEIGKVVDVINGIAGQTNMLALNASIEAAGAGEAGRGFAVVAEEVKALAKQTGQATSLISRQVEEIRERYRQVRESVSQISGSVERMDGLSAEIDHAVEEQGNSSREIARATEEVSQAAGEVTRSAREMEAAVAEVSRSALEASHGTAEIASSAASAAQASEAVVLAVAQARDGAAKVQNQGSNLFHRSAEVQKMSLQVMDLVAYMDAGLSQVGNLTSLVRETATNLDRARHGLEIGEPPFDLQKVKQAHLNWLVRLDQLVSGRLPMAKMGGVAYGACEFGQWQDARQGTGDFSGMAEFQELGRIHGEMHRVMEEVVALVGRGRQEEARGKSDKLGEMRQGMFLLLDHLYQEPVAKPRHRVSGEAPGEKKAQHIQHM